MILKKKKSFKRKSPHNFQLSVEDNNVLAIEFSLQLSVEGAALNSLLGQDSETKYLEVYFRIKNDESPGIPRFTKYPAPHNYGI